MDCGTLTNPVNGQVNHTAGTTFEQTATYSCNTGYNLVGDGTRTCQATGVWSGNAPTCQGTAVGNLVTVNSISGPEAVNDLKQAAVTAWFCQFHQNVSYQNIIQLPMF